MGRRAGTKRLMCKIQKSLLARHN